MLLLWKREPLFEVFCVTSYAMSVFVFCAITCGHFCIFYFLIVNCDVTLIIIAADDTDVVPEELSQWISIPCPWFWFSTVSCLVVVWVQRAEATSKARADGAVCFNRGTNRFHSQLWEIEVLHGVTQDNKACLTGGPIWEAGGQSKANVLHQDHSIVVCFSHVLLCGKGLDLTLTISLAFHITSHWAVLVSVRQYAVLLLNMQVKLIHIATIYHFSLVQSESRFQKTQKDKLSIVFLRTEKTSSITVNSSPRLQRGWIKFRTRW